MDNRLEYQRNGKLLFRKYREFFLPTILASVTVSMSIIVDSIIVGNLLGAEEMAAVNLCLPVVQVFFMVAVLLGMGSSTLIAIALGKRENKQADMVFSTAIMGVLICSFLLTFTFLYADNIASLLTTDKILQPLVYSYLRVLLAGSIFLIVIPVFTYILRTDNMVKFSSRVLIVTNLSNLILDVVFIKLFKMGIEGSSLATVSGYVLGCLMLITYIRSGQRMLHFEFNKETIHCFFVNIKEIILTGLPATLSSGLVALKIFLINLIIGTVSGSTGLIIFSVCISCLSFVSMFISGTAGTMMPIVGTLYGEKDFKGIRLILGYTVKIGLLASSLVVLIFELIPAKIFGLFGVTDPNVLAEGIPALRIFAISLVGVTITFLLMYYFMTIKKSKIANTLSLLEGLLILVPTAFLLSKILGLTGVWLSFIIAEVVALSIFYIQVITIRKRNKYPDMLLIEKYTPEKLYDASLIANSQDASNLSEEVIKVLRNNNIPLGNANKAGIAVEEMVYNASVFQRNKNKKVNVDIMVSSVKDEIIISIRDDGASFNPVAYRNDEKEFTTDGIILLQKLASSLEYSQVLSLNQTLISISRTT